MLKNMLMERLKTISSHGFLLFAILLGVCLLILVVFLVIRTNKRRRRRAEEDQKEKAAGCRQGDKQRERSAYSADRSACHRICAVSGASDEAQGRGRGRGRRFRGRDDRNPDAESHEL